MTLVERTRQLYARIEEYTRLAKAHKDAAVTRNRSEEMKEARVQLSGTLARISVLRDEGGVVFVLPDPTTTLQATRDYVAQLKMSDDEVGKLHNKLRRSAKKLQDELDKALASAISSLEKSIPSIDEAYLKEVELIPGFASQVQDVRRERAALLSGRALSEMDAMQLSVFLKKREFVKSLAERLTPDDFPREVRDFFAAMRRGGATLEKFTDAVRQWLGDRDQLRNVRITLVQPR